MKTLTPKTRQALKGKAHSLRPIIFIGNNGLSDNVKKEIDRALTDHELIKIKISGADRDERQALFTQICELTTAEAVQLIGNVGVIYRKNDE